MDFLEFLAQKKLAKSGGGGVADSKYIAARHGIFDAGLFVPRKNRARREPSPA